jgi:hypothetical protein
MLHHHWDAPFSSRLSRDTLNKDAPVSRLVQRRGVISSRAILGELRDRYTRI